MLLLLDQKPKYCYHLIILYFSDFFNFNYFGFIMLLSFLYVCYYEKDYHAMNLQVGGLLAHLNLFPLDCFDYFNKMNP